MLLRFLYSTAAESVLDRKQHCNLDVETVSAQARFHDGGRVVNVAYNIRCSIVKEWKIVQALQYLQMADKRLDLIDKGVIAEKLTGI